MLSLLLVLAPVSHAATNAGGLSMRWANCIADRGIANRVFACDTNAGRETLVCSYQTDAHIQFLNAAELTLDIRVDADALPTWWQFKTVGSCRQASLAMNMIPSASIVNCVDQWEGLGVGGIGFYNMGLLAPNMSRIRAAVALAATVVFDAFPGNEYWVASFTVDHARTVGASACGGCLAPACILFAELIIRTGGGSGDRTFTQPKDGNTSHWVGWQGGVASTPQIVCDADGCNYQFGCVALPVANPSSSWGALKALYH